MLFCRHTDELYDQSILTAHNIIIWKVYSEGSIGTVKNIEVIYFFVA